MMKNDTKKFFFLLLSSNKSFILLNRGKPDQYIKQKLKNGVKIKNNYLYIYESKNLYVFINIF